MPHVLDTAAPSIAIVGIQGAHGPATLERAAALALQLVCEPPRREGAEVSS
jgi:hypothetical protein